MTTLITLVIPVGGDAGPFNLYSNIDGFIQGNLIKLSPLIISGVIVR